jgi:hypothetical protein
MNPGTKPSPTDQPAADGPTLEPGWPREKPCRGGRPSRGPTSPTFSPEKSAGGEQGARPIASVASTGSLAGGWGGWGVTRKRLRNMAIPRPNLALRLVPRLGRLVLSHPRTHGRSHA